MADALEMMMAEIDLGFKASETFLDVFGFGVDRCGSKFARSTALRPVRLWEQPIQTRTGVCAPPPPPPPPPPGVLPISLLD